ncbi:MAG: hypothetical protein ACK5RC_15160 [Curvibacter sp.]|jgi:hypothetical protein
MNRCSELLSFLCATALGGLLALSPLTGRAQTSTNPSAATQAQPLPQRIPPISARAQRGVLRIVQPPEVLLNSRPARLAPGARIRNRNNLIVVSAALLAKDLPVRYTLDPMGLVHEVWVLTAEEAARDPVPLVYNPQPQE